MNPAVSPTPSAPRGASVTPTRRRERVRLLRVLAMWLAVTAALLPFGYQGREPNTLIAFGLTWWAAMRASLVFGRGESVAWSAGVGYGFYALSWGVQRIAAPLLHTPSYRPRWDLPLVLAVIIVGLAFVLVRLAERDRRRRAARASSTSAAG